ncbi:MAG: BatA domain-containing protein, partial [Gemmataceae bacterium]|nr:BatA domain-containing protein [Gemmataceae bacterium]
LAPLMLTGAAAVTVPIALHFFYRARYKPLPWAPMKFLKEAIEQTSRRLKFQEWLLLALRCLALLLLALAIARPAQESLSAGTDDTVDAVFVIDTSYSMAARDGEKTRLERAKEAALAALDALPGRSSVRVYTCADRATNLGPTNPLNRDQARQLIQNVEVTSLSTDLLPGLGEALAAADAGSAPAKEIYVFTDMQQSGFERQTGSLRAKCDELVAKKNVQLIFVRCANPERKLSNVSVADVEVRAPILHTKTRVPFVVTLKNTGREALRGVKVSLELDGKAVERDVQQVEQIDAGGTATITLTGALEQAGARLLAVYADGDGVEGDNVLYKVINVRERVRVLLVAHPFAGRPYTDAGDWFVRKALVPFDPDRDRDRIDKYFIETESVLPHEAGPDKLNGRDVVFLLNAAAGTNDPLSGVSPAFVARLVEFVKGGGGLVVGCGDRVTAEGYNRVLGAKGAGLLPLPLGDVRNETEATPFALSGDSTDQTPALGKLRLGELRELAARATCTRLFALDESSPEAAGGRVIARTTTNLPMVATRVVGEGEVFFFTTALDETWGSRLMAEGRLALPMMTYLLEHLTNRKVPGGTRMAGDTLSWAPPSSAQAFELLKPRPRKGGTSTRPRARLTVPPTEEGQKIVVSTTDSAVAGEYAIVPVGGGEGDGVTFAVNPDLRETENLDGITDSDLEKLLGFKPLVIQAGAGTEIALRERRAKTEWTVWLLLALLLLLVGEAAWAWACGRAW